MTMGLFGFVINAALLLLIAWVAELAKFDFTVGDFPPDLLTADTHRRRGHRRHRRSASSAPSCGLWSATERPGPAARSADAPARPRAGSGRRSTSRTWRPSTRRAAAVCAAFPDPWLRQYSVKANDVPADHRGGRPPAGSARTSSRAANGPPPRRAGLPNDRITLEGIGKTAGRPARGGPGGAATGRPLRWVAIEVAEEAAALAAIVADAAGRARRRSTSSTGSIPTSRPRPWPAWPSAPAAPSSG